jgi:hypothetical protein
MNLKVWKIARSATILVIFSLFRSPYFNASP